MTAEDLEAKFLSLAESAVGKDAAAAILEGATALFDAANIAPFARDLGALHLTERSDSI